MPATYGNSNSASAALRRVGFPPSRRYYVYPSSPPVPAEERPASRLRWLPQSKLIQFPNQTEVGAILRLGRGKIEIIEKGS